jgi:site-specific recombinase XerD
MMSRTTFRKVIVTPELLEQVNPKNKQLCAQFLREKDTRSSDTTVEGYTSDLNIFLTWNLLFNGNKFFTDITKLEFSDYFYYCTKILNYGSARFNRMRSCLSVLSQFVEKYLDSEYPQFRNIILKTIATMPKVERREKTILSDEQIDDLFHYLDVEIGHIQEATLLALAIASGSRVSELFRFQCAMIDEKSVQFNGLFLETTSKIKTKGRTKQGDMKNKYIIKDVFLPYYYRWLPVRKEIMQKNGKEHDFIFIRADGSPANVATFRSWIVKWEKRLKVPVYPHAFRHRIVSYLTRIGLPENLIIELMGWRSGGAMYKIYNDNEAKDMEWKELDKLKQALAS